MFGMLLGVAVVVLFHRLAQAEDESPELWAGLAVLAHFGPALLLGTLWGLGGSLLLGAAFVVRVMTRRPPGRGLSR